MYRFLNVLVTVTALSLCLTADSVAQQTTNNVLHAVPVPKGKVAIDGKLDDWDLSGEIMGNPNLWGSAQLEAPAKLAGGLT